eukprot:XP_011414857.1 PREDICTED: perlucin [Crassostrea gigas]
MKHTNIFVFLLFSLSTTKAYSVRRQDPGTPHGGVQCPHLFYRGHNTCYRVVRIQATWPEALAYCEAYRAELAIIQSAEEQKLLENYIKTEAASLSSHTFWLGASDIMTEGDWRWAVTLDQVTYQNWAQGAPNNGHNLAHCLHISGGSGFLWKDGNCENKHYFVCETLL